MTEDKQTRLIPLVDWPKHHAWPPIGGLRHLVFHAGATGFDKVVKRVGRRVLIDETAFFSWALTNPIMQTKRGNHGDK